MTMKTATARPATFTSVVAYTRARGARRWQTDLLEPPGAALTYPVHNSAAAAVGLNFDIPNK